MTSQYLDMYGNKKQKIGLALGSGAARGLAHIGVLKALIEKGISIDMLAGSSMGALVGACYAKEGEIANFEEIVLKTDWKQLVRLADPNLALLFRGFIHGQKVKELLRTIIGDIEFKDLKIPLAVVATDVNTGEEVIIKEGSVVEAVRASISIPAIFMPVRFSAQEGFASGASDRFLMDGGIVNPVPVKVVKDMGATFVIACNVIQEPKKRKTFNLSKRQKFSIPISKSRTRNLGLLALNNKINELVRENKNRLQKFQKIMDGLKERFYKGAQRIDADTPTVFDVMLQAIYAMEYEIARLKIKEANVVISPNTGYIAALEFYRGTEAISEGYKAAMEAIPDIRKLIS